jgi:hypothetical protein
VLAALPKSAHPGALAAIKEIYNAEDVDKAQLAILLSSAPGVEVRDATSVRCGRALGGVRDSRTRLTS